MSAISVLRDAIGRYPRAAVPLRALYRRLWRVLAARRERETLALFEVLARRLVEDPVLSVAEFDGTFALDARSALFRRIVTGDGAYEPTLSALCRLHVDPHRDVLDIGANVGFHTVLFARTIGPGCRVLAVEPSAAAAARLDRNLARNDVAERVVVHRGAVADRAGSMTLKTIGGCEEFSTLGEMAHPAVAEADWHEERVAVDTLDALVGRHELDPGFVKVDVEGVEHLVFGGARALLSDARPVVLTELSDALLRVNGASAGDIVKLFTEHGYRVEDPLHPGAVPGSRDFGDLLCVPDER